MHQLNHMIDEVVSHRRICWNTCSFAGVIYNFCYYTLIFRNYIFWSNNILHVTQTLLHPFSLFILSHKQYLNQRTFCITSICDINTGGPWYIFANILNTDPLDHTTWMVMKAIEEIRGNIIEVFHERERE